MSLDGPFYCFNILNTPAGVTVNDMGGQFSTAKFVGESGECCFKPQLLLLGVGVMGGATTDCGTTSSEKTIASIIKTQTVQAQEPDCYCDPNKNMLFFAV
jgi:hypothetical protein